MKTLRLILEDQLSFNLPTSRDIDPVTESVLPNVSGMALFAERGFLASKPHAAGGAYINRTSDHYKDYRRKVVEKTGQDACPFNYLYWNFLARNRHKIFSNLRLGMIYRTYDWMSPEKQASVTMDADRFLTELA